MNAPIPPHPPRYPELTPPPRPMRKRMKRREGPNEVRFLTFSCQRRLPLFDDPLARADFVRALAAARRKRRCELFAWVLMPEHVHLLLRPHKEDTADALLKSIKLGVSERAINRWKRGGEEGRAMLERVNTETGPRFWQKGGGFDRNVRDLTEFTREVLYCHQNPVRRGLVKLATQWAWSSVHRWLERNEGRSGVESADERRPLIDPPPGKDRDWTTWRGFMEWPAERTRGPSSEVR